MAQPLKVLQLGSGSMGTRRLRDLSKRSGVEVRLFDQRADRRAAAAAKFGVGVFESLEAALDWGPQALVISTPPGTKGQYTDLSLDLGLHHFVEADMWGYGVSKHLGEKPGLVLAPSLSFGFLPVVQTLLKRVPATIGRLLGYQFVLAGDMAGWHPTEGKEYYGRHRDTAPAREMVPFELAWLAMLFGDPVAVAGQYGLTSGRADSFEDTWSLQLELKDGASGQVIVTMACPNDIRRGSAQGTTGSASWDINKGEIILQAADGKIETLNFGPIGAAIETSYAAEINAYVDAIQGGTPWVHGYRDYQRAIATLAAAEASAHSGGAVRIDSEADPSRVLAPAPIRR
jgi:predicted dehydrogenase